MAASDGNGWVECVCGERHWGRHGAAGLLLLRRRGEDIEPEVLLQLRAPWTHEGGRWGLPGGARDSHEDAAQAALREAAEEAAVDPGDVRVLRVQPGVDHGVWNYTYVLAAAVGPVRPRQLTAESDDLRWVPVSAVAGLPLHHGFAGSWAELAAGLADAALEVPVPGQPPTGDAR